MTMHEVWLGLVQVVSHRVSVSSFTSILTICPSGSFHLNKSSVLFVCGEKLANQAMVLKDNLHMKHLHLCEKPIEYFKWLIADQICQAEQWTKITTIFHKAQEASYAIGKIIAKKMNKSHTNAELSS